MQIQAFNIETLLLVCKRSRGLGFAGEVTVWFLSFFKLVELSEPFCKLITSQFVFLYLIISKGVPVFKKYVFSIIL